jgi:sugar lactone lactonase YvrE
MLPIYRTMVVLSVLLPVSGFGQTLYWSQDPGSSLSSSDVSAFVPQIRDTLNGAFAIAAGTSSLYWTEPNANRIRFGGHQSGTDATLLNLSADTTIPRGIAVFASANMIYWSDSKHGRIECARLSDGQNVRTIVSGLSSPGMMALDASAHKLYWIDNGTGKKSISRCDTSGSTVEVVVSGLSQAWGLALDPSNSLVYWIDNGVGRILEANYGGTLPTTGSNLATQVAISDNVRGLTLDATNGELYWADITDNSIHRVTTAGSSPTQVVLSTTYAQGIALNPAGDVLPVELSTFTANTAEGVVTLHWTTQTEIGTYKFEIERRMMNSTNVTTDDASGAWTTVGSVHASGTTASPHTYSFSDRNVSPGNYEYQIVMIDLKGNSKVSGTVDVVVGSAPKAFSLSQNYPNPFNPSTVISFDIPKETFVSLVIYNALGQELARLVNETRPAGRYSVTFDAGNLPSGLYVSRLTAGGFSATKKMVLVK